MVLVENPLRFGNVLLELRLLAPRKRKQNVEIVARDRRLRGHRRHRLQFLQFGIGARAGFLRQPGLANFLGKLLELVAAFVAFVAKLALDRLQLLVEVIFALRLLHLPLDAAADLLLDLENAELALHEGEDHFEAARGVELAEQSLLVGNLDRQVGGNRVGEDRRVLDLGELDSGLGRKPLVELGVIFELVDDRAHQRLRLGAGRRLFVDFLDFGDEIALARFDVHQPRPLHALDEHADGAVRKLQKLHGGGDDAEIVESVAVGIVLAGIELRDQEQLAVVGHCAFERSHRLLAPDEQRNDAVREDDDVTKRQNGEEASHGHHMGLGSGSRNKAQGTIAATWPL